MDLNDIARNKAEQIMKNKGVVVSCPSCKNRILAKSGKTTVCPSCHKSFNFS